MTTAQLRRHWHRVVPWRLAHKYLDRVSETIKTTWWFPYKLFVPKATQVAEASKVAGDLARARNLVIFASQQRVGFIRIWISHQKRPGEQQTWCLDIYNNVHFRGRWTKVHELRVGMRIEIEKLSEPSKHGDPTRPESHIRILTH